MEPLSTLAVTVAAGVLSRVIGDGIQRRRRRIDQATLNQAIAQQVSIAAGNIGQVNVGTVTARAAAEVRGFAAQMPGVTVQTSGLKITPISPSIAVTPSRRAQRRQEVQLRLRLLDALVEKRRVELGLDLADHRKGQDRRGPHRTEDFGAEPAGGEVPVFVTIERASGRRPEEAGRPTDRDKGHGQSVRERLDAIDIDIEARQRKWHGGQIDDSDTNP